MDRCPLGGKRDSVPAVDIVIAGFSCKSVSTENHERQEHGECIVRGTGSTGETFRGRMEELRRHHRVNSIEEVHDAFSSLTLEMS